MAIVIIIGFIVLIMNDIFKCERFGVTTVALEVHHKAQSYALFVQIWNMMFVYVSVVFSLNPV